MFRVIVLAFALLAGGCGILHQEFNNRGGYVDYLADKYWWKADSKKMRALRAYALHTAIARIAMISPKGAPQRDQMAYQLGRAAVYTQQLVTCAYDSPDEPCFYFDSIMVDYVAALYDAAIAALPLDDARKLINDITGGIFGPAAAVDALRALIDLGANAFRYGAVAGALYRDALELEVQVWISSPSQPGSLVTTDDVRPLKMIYDTGKDNIPAWKLEIERLLSLGLEPTPSRIYFARLFKLMTYACGQITQVAVFHDSCVKNPDLNPSGRGSAQRGSGGTTGSGGATTNGPTTAEHKALDNILGSTIESITRDSKVLVEVNTSYWKEPRASQGALLGLATQIQRRSKVVAEQAEKGKGLAINSAVTVPANSALSPAAPCTAVAVSGADKDKFTGIFSNMSTEVAKLAGLRTQFWRLKPDARADTAQAITCGYEKILGLATEGGKLRSN